MYIGAVTKQTGASAKAVRLYETLGLLGLVERKGTYRYYNASQLNQIMLICQAQQLGFRLAELNKVLGPDASAPDWPALLQHLADKQTAVQLEIMRLQQLEQQLKLAMQDIM
ncbi:MerR family transcriptional regulator [Rheinheimera nanhaiensis]|uniref:MerR family transcriptional regulator n=1 Tax=Rheinheimera nanhaiensis E407-8 TaxID=562729 RepID=I1E348_9GAMM|nr:MerR family transcriptional regulator [Rheinheimera nanhaiensis]GAB60726.1 MerR family transcriptional regulator [Rheinheimera nanhaiensis E407-8]